MIVMKHFYGEEAYQSIIKEKQARLERFKRDGKTIPSIFKNGSKNKVIFSQVALYQKGPLILDQFIKLMGEEKLLMVMRNVFERKIKTSEEFISLVGSLVSPEMSIKARELIVNF